MNEFEKMNLLLTMAEFGYTSNRHFDYTPYDWPKEVRDAFQKAKEYPAEIKISAKDNPEVYLKEIKRIAESYYECIGDCDNPLDYDIRYIIEDVEELEKVFNKEDA